MAVLMTLLNISVIKFRAVGPKCFSMTGERPSGPVELEFFAALIILQTSLTWKKKEGVSLGGFWRLRQRDLRDFVGFILAEGVYWAFNLLAIWRGFLYSLSLNDMLWLGGGGGMASRFLMVCQSFLLPG